MQNQRNGTSPVQQEDEHWHGRELNRHAARANAAHDRHDALEQAVEQLAAKWREGAGELRGGSDRRIALHECADELERVLDALDPLRVLDSPEDAP